jgi:putative acetyltransferase
MTKVVRTKLENSTGSFHGLLVRSFADGDAPALAGIFHRSVHEGAAARYTPEECAAWSPEVPDTRSWELRLAEADTVVAELPDGPVGFMSLDMGRAYLDLAFVLPEVMGRGIAGVLYAVLEGRARARGLSRLETEASLLAEPFFARHGWRLVRRQKVERLGVLLSNAVMEKPLERVAAFA